jgi:tetratricopeptide (TPR) repeat protein
MSNHLEDDSVDIELIERYHKGQLAEAELANFLQRQKSDREFANKVRSYSEVIEGIEYYGMQQDFAETIREWEKEIKDGVSGNDLNDTGDTTPDEGRRIIPINRNRSLWWGAAIAASLAFVVVMLTFFPKSTPRRLAENYIDSNLTTLSTTMSGDADRLAEGINAFNKKDYATAENVFLSLSRSEDLAAETTKYLGIIYLHTGDYEKAIEQFNKLISYTSLYVNPGKFYLAVTLMKRSGPGDQERARELLQEVVEGELPGSSEARNWLRQLD